MQIRTRRRRAWILPLVLSLALVAAACGGDDDDGETTQTTAEGGKKGGVFRLGIVEPAAIDPYNAHESEGILIAQNLYEGLAVVDDETTLLKPGVAESWEKNADCTEWTFKLRNSKFSDGSDVTAESFIFGWTRAAKQAAASDVAYHLAGIKGYEELHGKDEEGAPPATATTFAGATAPDKNTLKVSLSEGDCEFDKKTVHPVFSPVPTSAGAHDNKTFNDMPIGNGPFKMKEPWQHDSRITLVRNDSYHGTKTNIDEVQITILPSEGAQEAEYKGFQAGQFDYARIPPTLLPQAKAAYDSQGSFLAEPKFGINYLLPIGDKPPFNNPDARKAVSMAIDRDAIISGVFSGFQTKATSLLSPPFKDFFQPGLCCDKPDVAKAKELAAKSGLAPGTKVNLTFNTGGGHEQWVQAVAQQLKDNLGLDVNIVPMPFREMLAQQISPQANGLYRLAWGADYPTPDNFLFPLLSKRSFPPGDNRARYDNPKFDTLLDQARAAKSTADQAKAIKEAEKIAIGDDLALIPLWYRTQYRVWDSTKWQGVKMDFFENPTMATASLK